MALLIVNKLLLLTVNNFINGKWDILTALYKDGIAVYTCDHSFLNFVRCMSQSRRKIEKLDLIIFLEKLEQES